VGKTVSGQRLESFLALRAPASPRHPFGGDPPGLRNVPRLWPGMGGRATAGSALRIAPSRARSQGAAHMKRIERVNGLRKGLPKWRRGRVVVQSESAPLSSGFQGGAPHPWTSYHFQALVFHIVFRFCPKARMDTARCGYLSA